jgi:hypothetical protein
MPEVNDAMEAERIVRSHYGFPGPEPCEFNTHKQGYTWIIRYHVRSVTDTDEHEMRIDSHTGRILRDI